MKILENFITDKKVADNAHYAITENKQGHFSLQKKSSGEEVAVFNFVGSFFVAETGEEKIQQFLIEHFSEKKEVLTLNGEQKF